MAEEDGEKKIEWLHKSFVTEWPDIKIIIDTLSPNSPDSEFIRMQIILGKYQEQPQLLDTHLIEIIQQLTQLIINHYDGFNTKDLEHLKIQLFIMKCFSLLYVISKVRGYKAILKYFPHEVARVEQLFFILRYFSIPQNIKIINDLIKEENQKNQSKSSSFSTVTSISNKGQILKFASQDIFETEIWHSEYIACLWLSVAILVPFNLSIILSNNNNENNNNNNNNNDEKEIISSQIRIWCQNIIYRSDISATPTLTSSSLLLSKLLLRPDLNFEIENFLNWGINLLQSPDLQSSSSSQVLISVLTLLSFVLKVNSRNVLLNYSHLLKTIIEIISAYSTKGVTQRNLVLKVCGRIAICYLAPRKRRSWHYHQQNQSLLANLSLSINQPHLQIDSSQSTEKLNEQEEEEEELEEDVQEIVEQVTGILIQGIKDADTKIRWSSSKRLSYLAERLPLSFTDQIIEFILNLFDPLEDDAAWHGGCLALAEMARRGVLALHRLNEATEKVFQAFEYDVKVGNTGKGANVRDAACYVAWAFARSFDQFVLKEYIPQLSRALILMSLFDREVNCRRAAAAAFQENVGRQGGPACVNVPHGIDIINIADYFSIGNRRESYLNIASTIARFEEYQIVIINYLVDFKIFHWDSVISQLAAESLGKLTLINPKHIIDHVLPKIVPLAGSSKFEYRFGGILSISEILLSLQSQNLISNLSQKVTNEIISIIPNIIKNVKLLRRKGNKMIMNSICHLIHAISLSQLPIPLSPDQNDSSKVTLEDYEKVIYDCITHLNEDVQLAGVHSLRSFSVQYHVQYDDQKKQAIIDQYINKLAKDTNVQVRRGSALALGAISSSVHQSSLPSVIRSLIAKISGNKKEKDAEVRRNSIESLLEICKKNDIYQTIGRSQVHSIVRCFLKGLEDYSVDNRGDVGSWIREASILSLCQISHLLCVIDNIYFDLKEMSDEERKNTEFFTEKMCTIIFTSLLKQAVEKFDRIRDIAVNAILFLLYSENEKYIYKSKSQFALRIRQQNRLEKLPQFQKFIKIKYIPHYDQIVEYFNPEINQTNYNFNWTTAERTFPIFVQFLQFECFHLPILSGLILSVGGISKAVVQESSKALLNYLENNQNQLMIPLNNNNIIESDSKNTLENTLASSLIIVGKKITGNDSNFISLLKTLNLLFENQYFFSQLVFSTDLFKLIESEIANTNDTNKLREATTTLIHLLLFQSSARTSAIQLLLNLLVHSFPLIRQNTSENLYLCMITYDDVFLINQEEINAILSETNWLESSIEDLQQQKGQLVSLFGAN